MYDVAAHLVRAALVLMKFDSPHITQALKSVLHLLELFAMNLVYLIGLIAI